MPIHASLTDGRWHKLSFVEQMGNIGSEVSRALNWKNKDENAYKNALWRALELIDLTIADSRWHMRLKEITRVREFLIDAMDGGKTYQTTFEDIDRYFLQFAVAARIRSLSR